MKRQLSVVGAMLLFTVPAMADMVNFYAAPYANVNTTTGFGGDGLSGLGYHSIDILDGDATLYAWGSNGGVSLEFSQRELRGLGIYGGTGADSVDGREVIRMIFRRGYYVNSVELRSLFNHPTGAVIEVYRSWGTPAQAHTHSWIVTEDVSPSTNGSVVTNLGVGGVPPSYGPLGDVLLNPGDGLQLRILNNTVVDAEFALAALDVRPVPVPGAVLLGMIGLGLAGMRLRRHA